MLVSGVHASGVSPFRRTMKGRNMVAPMNLSLFEWRRYFPWTRDILGDNRRRIQTARKAEEVQHSPTVESVT